VSSEPTSEKRKKLTSSADPPLIGLPRARVKQDKKKGRG
jgi:hypothetical protein